MAHRYREVPRIEGFSGAVSGFAITLLVVSLEVPRTHHELMHGVRGFPAFAVGFALLFQLWWRHYRFFRNITPPQIGLAGLVGFVEGVLGEYSSRRRRLLA